MFIFFKDEFSIGTISIPHFGQCPEVSLITWGCILQVYFSALIVFEVSEDAAGVVFLLLSVLLPLHAAKIVATTSIYAMIACFTLDRFCLFRKYYLANRRISLELYLHRQMYDQNNNEQ